MQVPTRTEDNSHDVAVADFNSDGSPDLLVVGGRYDEDYQPNPLGTKSNTLFLGDGHGGFSQDSGSASDPASSPFVPVNQYHADIVGLYVFAADLNADGHTDVFLTSGDAEMQVDIGSGRSTWSSWLYWGDGALGFTLYSGSGAFGSGVAHLIAEDLNGDGALDLYMTKGGGISSTNELYLSDGNSGYIRDLGRPIGASPNGAVTSAGNSWSTLAADLTADGNLDFYVCNVGNNQLFVGDGAGGFTEETSGRGDGRIFATATKSDGETSTSDSAVFADLSGDGNDDLFVCSRDGPSQLFLGDGSGSYTEDMSTKLRASFYCFDVDVADLDGDGDLDVYLTVNKGGQPNALFLGDGAGGFNQEENIPPTWSRDQSTSTVLADLNGDGLVDMYLANKNSANQAFFAGYCAGRDGYRVGPIPFRLCFACPGYSLTSKTGPENACEYFDGGRVGPPEVVPLSPAKSFMCLSCVAGKYRARADSIGECRTCPAGLFAPTGQPACTQCSMGRVPITWSESVKTGAGSCVTCQPGSAPNANRTSCEACAAGRVSDGSSWCKSCNGLGEHANAEQSYCDTCNAGQRPSDDRTSCVPCETGAVSPLGIGCEYCGPGETPNEALSECDDVNECAVDYGRCDQRAKCGVVANGTDFNQYFKGCENKDHTQGARTAYKCGPCPTGLTAVNGTLGGLDDQGQPLGSTCQLPPASSGQASVQPSTTLQMNLSPTVLEEDHPDRAVLTAALIRDLAASMGVDPSLIVISNIKLSTDRRRRRLQAAVAVQFDFEIVGGNDEQLTRLTASLADPGGPLLNGEVTSLGLDGGIVAGQTPQTEFVCPAGKKPSADGTFCEFCVGQNGEPEYTADRETCSKCPVGENPNSIRDGCICNDFFYDATSGPLVCYDVGANFAASDFPSVRDADAGRCLPCDDSGCLVCKNGVASIAQGFMVSESTVATGSGSGSASAGVVGPLAIFVCPLEGTDENPACNGTQPDGTSMCGTGYSKALCSMCATGYSKSGDDCIDCADASGYGPAITAALVGLVILLGCIVMSCYSRKIEGGDEMQSAARDEMQSAAGDSMDAGGDMVEDAGGGGDLHLMVLGKILTGLFQILSEMPAALALTFPVAFTAVLNAMKVFLFDIFEVFRMDCISPLSVHAKFIVVMLLPLVGIVTIRLLQCIANARAGHGGADAELVVQRWAEAKASSAYRTFFVIFLLYPLLSRTAFHMTPTARPSATTSNGIWTTWRSTVPAGPTSPLWRWAWSASSSTRSASR